MPVKLTRQRGKVWYAGGTVKSGLEGSRTIPDHSTGHRAKEAAEAYVARLNAQIQLELAHGPAGRARSVTWGECARRYLDRPEPLHANDIWRIGELGKVLEHTPLAELLDGWARFRRRRCAGRSPSTVDRFRAILQAAANHGCAELGIAAPRVPTIRFKNERIRFLTLAEQEALLAAYNPHARPVALTLCFQGCRTQEALQLLWRHVDLARETLFFARTKNGEPRTVRMHGRVFAAIAALWLEREPRPDDHVFLSSRDAPYADTRDYKLPGGNPLRSAHRTACKRAGVVDFRPHDFRHHFASWAIMCGVDPVTLKKIGGWKTLKMVERYASVSTEHMADAMRKIEEADHSQLPQIANPLAANIEEAK